jgi:GH25 family lysozyme M1 (1,4-beta-N-acetylmuramidase)
MNALLKDAGNNTMMDFEAVKGSHVFLKVGDIEHYMDWNETPEDVRTKALQAMAKVEKAFTEAREDLRGAMLLRGIVSGQ